MHITATCPIATAIPGAVGIYDSLIKVVPSIAMINRVHIQQNHEREMSSAIPEEFASFVDVFKLVNAEEGYWGS